MAKIDWLSFTCPHEQLESLVEWFYQFGVKPSERGAMGYDYSYYVAGTGRLLWSSNPEKYRMGVHVVLPSSALDVLYSKGYDWAKLFQVVMLFGGKVARLDIAFDDKCDDGSVPLLDLQVIDSAIRERSYASHLRNRRVTEDLETRGVTYYLGSGQSDVLVRIYDKQIEQKVDYHWIRVELQLRDKKADNLFRMSADACCNDDAFSDMMSEVLLSILDFKDIRIDDTNVSRCETSAWWALFVQTACKLSVSLRKIVDESIDRSRAWIEKQVSGTLRFLVSVNGGFDWLVSAVADGEMSKSKQAVISMLDAVGLYPADDVAVRRSYTMGLMASPVFANEDVFDEMCRTR